MSTVIVLTTSMVLTSQDDLQQAFSSAMLALLEDIKTSTFNRLPFGCIYSDKKFWNVILVSRGTRHETTIPATMARLVQSVKCLPDSMLFVYPKDLIRIRSALKQTPHTVRYYNTVNMKGRVARASD